MSSDDRHEPGGTDPAAAGQQARPELDRSSNANSDHGLTTPQQRRLREAMDRVARQRPVTDTWASIRARVVDPDTNHVVVVDGADRRRGLRAPHLAAAAIVVVALVAGGIALTNRDPGGGDSIEVAVVSPQEAAPTRGGTLRYGITHLPTSGLCLPEAQLFTEDEIVAGALFDPLMAINGDGLAVPYLAESMTANADHTVWTITLRPGVTFHDGTPLDAEVVKANIDAWRGVHVVRVPLINRFRFEGIAAVEVVDDLTVTVTTAEPWAALPANFATPSLGIMARAQLEADQATCQAQPIGTGPFSMDSWDLGAGTARLVRNTAYWQIAPDGEPYPYLDAVEFTSGTGPDDPADELADDHMDAFWTSSASSIAGPLSGLDASGVVDLHVTYETAQPSFVLLNNSIAPFDDADMRRALASALDRGQIAADVGLGDVTLANGPFAPSKLGHVEDPGFPTDDPQAARTIVESYVGSGGSAAFVLFTTGDSDDEPLAQAIADQARAVGFDVTVTAIEGPAVMDRVINGSFHAAIHRDPAAADPDWASIFWNGRSYPATTDPMVASVFPNGGPNPMNFGRFGDSTLDDLLRRGRTTGDPAERATAYEDLTRHFASAVHLVWLWYQPAAVAARPGTGSITGPPLPDGSEPTSDLSLPHRLLGMTAP